MRWFLVLALVTGVAHADDATDVAAAEQRLADGDWAGAESLGGPVAASAKAARPDRAEAMRVVGLARYFAGRKDEAEAAFLDYLRLQPDAHLDPAVVPPDAVVFFDAVRSRHAGELALARPHPHVHHVWALNLLPPLGQFQNGDRALGWVVGGLELGALAANLATYTMLRARCDETTLVCSNTNDARRLRTLNLVTGGIALGTYLFGVVHGAARFEPYGERITFAAVPMTGGLYVSLGWGL